MAEIDFLSIDDLIHAHAGQVALYGGDPGLRDMGLLESANAQPSASFGGQFLHSFPCGMAAAYMFHIVSNHPFIDGNKRTGIVAALVFLNLNDFEIDASEESVYDITLAVANGEKDKREVEAWIEKHIRPRT